MDDTMLEQEGPSRVSGMGAYDDMLAYADEDEGAVAQRAAEDDAAGQLDSMHLWPGDAGTLPQDARTALLRLVKGPYISEQNDAALWRALLNHSETIRSRLADMFLDLFIDAEAGVAFSRNVQVEGKDFPKAATAYTMTMLDTIMVLLLRKELQTAGASRVFIGQLELFQQMDQYRAIDKMDQSAFLKRLQASWTRLEKQRLLVKSDVEGRYEISPVLKLVFGVEEAAAVLDEYRRLKGADASGADARAAGPDGPGDAAETAEPAAGMVDNANAGASVNAGADAGSSERQEDLFGGLF